MFSEQQNFPLAIIEDTRRINIRHLFSRVLEHDAVETSFDIYFGFFPADLGSLQEFDQSLMQYPPHEIERINRQASLAHHEMMGELYMTLARSGLAMFNGKAIATMDNDMAATMTVGRKFHVDVTPVEMLQEEFEVEREAYKQSPGRVALTEELLSLNRHSHWQVMNSVLEEVGTKAIEQTPKIGTDPKNVGYFIAEQEGFSKYLLSFRGRLGAGYYFDDLQSYQTWFAAIMKTNFPRHFAQLSWEDINVPYAYYGMSSMILEIDGTGVKFRLVEEPQDRFPQVFKNLGLRQEAPRVLRPIKLTIESHSVFSPLIEQYVDGLRQTFQTVEIPGKGRNGLLVCCPRVIPSSLQKRLP